MYPGVECILDSTLHRKALTKVFRCQMPSADVVPFIAVCIGSAGALWWYAICQGEAQYELCWNPTYDLCEGTKDVEGSLPAVL